MEEVLYYTAFFKLYYNCAYAQHGVPPLFVNQLRKFLFTDKRFFLSLGSLILASLGVFLKFFGLPNAAKTTI